MPPRPDGRGHTIVAFPTCDCPTCKNQYGGAQCSACKGLEWWSLPSNCPGQPMTDTQMNEVYAGNWDYRCDLWVTRTSPDAAGRAS
jgi:hypothetical protein